MSFEWSRIHKWEERLEEQSTDAVYDYVFEFYNVSEITELTDQQIQEIDEYRNEELNEYSPLQIGFSNLINMHESETYVMEQSEDD